jgi:hypothetical protein
MRALTRTAATTIAVGALSVLAALPALAAGPTLSVKSASLVARGAAVNATVTVTCDPYTDYWGQAMTSTPVTITINEAVRRGLVTSATGNGDAVCDSLPHKVSILVIPTTYAFIKGPALIVATATLDSATTPAQLVGTVKIT